MWSLLIGCGGPEARHPPEPPTPAHRAWHGDDEGDLTGYELDLSRWPDPLPLLIAARQLILREEVGRDIALAGDGPWGIYRVSSETAAGDLEQVAPVDYVPEYSGGEAVAFGGDLVGDGGLDVVVYSMLIDGFSPIIPRPEMYVFRADLAGDVRMSAAWARFVVDTRNGQPFEVCGTGDLDGDGADDLAIGMTGGLDSIRSSIPIFLGPLAPGDHPVPDGGDVTVTAPIGESAGRHLGCGADLDGDGLLDLLVGADERTDGDGGAYLVSAPAASVMALDALGAPLWTGEPGGGQAGQALAMGGDLDGDGRPDAFLGAPQWDAARGRAYVVTDATGGPLAEAWLRVDGARASGWTGFDGDLGDLDGDGHDDLAVGSPGNVYASFAHPGTVAVFAGPLAGGIVDERDATWLVIGSTAPDGFGFSVEVGPVDPDGIADLAVGAPFDSSVLDDAGAVHLFLGGSAAFGAL